MDALLEEVATMSRCSLDLAVAPGFRDWLLRRQ